MFSKKNKGRKVKFINLAEHLAIQNDIVSRTVDSMLLHVLNNENAKERGDWSEIQKSLEASELPAPASTPLAGPKALRKGQRQSETTETRNAQ
jgi:hypothetical protein